jgi:hypothetical protein
MRTVHSFVIALLGGALLVGGCGGDDKKSSSTTAPSTAATTQAAAPPKNMDEAKQRLQAAGYKVADEKPEPLVRRADGGIVTPKEKIAVTGGELPSGTDVSVYSVSTPEDVAALQKLAGGGRSVVKGMLFFQAVEPGAADTVAQAASG